MAISLKNHEDRIIKLENGVSLRYENTPWIKCNPVTDIMIAGPHSRNKITFEYRIAKDVVWLKLGCMLKTNTLDIVVGTLPNWKYGEVIFDVQGFGDRGGEADGRSLRVDLNGNLRYNVTSVNQWASICESVASYPLTIYYIVRYNIYKLVMFLSHLNTKFGGERR